MRVAYGVGIVLVAPWCVRRALRVPCPLVTEAGSCGAREGEPCRNPRTGNTWRSSVHAARKRAADAEARERERLSRWIM